MILGVYKSRAAKQGANKTAADKTYYRVFDV